MGTTYFAVASANWSAPSTWSLTFNGAGGVGPPVAGDVAVLNGKTVAMDGSSISVGTLSNYGSNYGGNNSGSLTVSLTGNKTITCGTLDNKVTAMTVTGSANTFAFNGNIAGGSTGGYGVDASAVSGTSAIVVTGNVEGGGGSSTNNNAGLNVGACQSVTINGSCSGYLNTAITGTTAKVTVNGDLIASNNSILGAVNLTSKGGVVTCNNGNLYFDPDLGYPFVVGTFIWNPGATNFVSFYNASSGVTAYPSTSSVDPGQSNVASGTSYKINGVTKNGSASTATRSSTGIGL